MRPYIIHMVRANLNEEVFVMHGCVIISNQFHRVACQNCNGYCITIFL